MPRALLLILALAAVATAAAANIVASFDGIGPIRIGSTVAQLEVMLGRPVPKPSEPEDVGCFYDVGPEDIGIMIVNGVVSRLDVNEPGIKTDLGAQVGDAVSDVRRLYGAGLVESPRFYSGLPDLYLTYWSPDRRSALRFETSNGRVARYYVGRAEQVKYVEGCQ